MTKFFDSFDFSRLPYLRDVTRTAATQQDRIMSMGLARYSIVTFFFIGLLSVVVSDIPESWSFVFWLSRGVVIATLFASLVMPKHFGVVIFFLLLLVGRDFAPETVASIWRLELGPINPSWFVFALLIGHLYRFRTEFFLPKFLGATALWFAIVPVVAGLVYGGLFSENRVEQVPIDLKVPMMLFGTIALFIAVVRGNIQFSRVLLAAFVGGLLARHIVDVVYFLLKWGPELDTGITRVSEDSAKSAIAFLILLSLIVSLSKGRQKFYGLIGLVPAFALSIIYATRMIWVVFPICLAVMTSVIGFRRGLYYFALIFVMLLAGSALLRVVNADALSLVVARAKTINEGRSESKFKVDVSYNFISRIDPIRYAEAINIWDTNWRRKSLLWGNGYGGYFEDKAVELPDTLGTSYPDYSFTTGKFYRPHLFSLTFFHKYGFVGLIALTAIYLLPTFGLARSLRLSNRLSSFEMACLVALVAFMPMAMFQLYWSGKGLFIGGALIALCLRYAQHLSNGSSRVELPFTQLPDSGRDA